MNADWCKARLLQGRQVFELDKEPDRAGLTRGSFDEAVTLQGLDHAVNRGCRSAEVAFEVGLRGGAAVDLNVVVNIGQILTLLLGELGRYGWIRFRHRIYADREGIFAEAFEDAHFEDVNLAGDDNADRFLGGSVKVRAQLFGIGAGAW